MYILTLSETPVRICCVKFGKAWFLIISKNLNPERMNKILSPEFSLRGKD